MRKQRQLHLWIGLITSVLILVEAVTGLVMSEPWLIGVSKTQVQQRTPMNGQSNNGQDFGGDNFQPRNMSTNTNQGTSQNANQAVTLNTVQNLNQEPNVQEQAFEQDQEFNQGQQFGERLRGDFEGKDGGNSVLRFIKNLHAGKIGNTDIKIFADIAAIGLIILTITGIYLSVKILRAQYRSKTKLQTA